MTESKRIQGLEALELASQTGQDVWLDLTINRGPHPAMSAGEAWRLINAGGVSVRDFYTFTGAQ